jgi:hypothetical protein
VTKINDSFETNFAGYPEYQPFIVIATGDKNQTLKTSVEQATNFQFIYKPVTMDRLQEMLGPILLPLQPK